MRDGINFDLRPVECRGGCFLFAAAVLLVLWGVAIVLMTRC